MGDHKVGVMVLKIGRGNCQHQSGKPADGEQHYKRKCKKHGGLKADRSSKQRRHPIEDFNPGRHCNQHRRVHEEQLGDQRQADDKHVMRPNKKGQ